MRFENVIELSYSLFNKVNYLVWGEKNILSHWIKSKSDEKN
jgi:hypothetical protein